MIEVRRPAGLAAEIRMRDGEVEITGDPATINFLTRFKCGDLSIDDGEPWMEALPEHLHGTYLWAEKHPDQSEATAAVTKAALQGLTTTTTGTWSNGVRWDSQTGSMESLEHRSSPELVAALAQTAGRPWALRPEAMEVLTSALRSGIAGPLIRAELEEEVEADLEPEPTPAGGVSLHQLHGVITPGAPGGLLGELLGLGGGLDEFKAGLLQAAASDDVSHMVVDVNSPGGLVDLVPEMAAMIRQIREHKPITAVANTAAVSAAYWLASQATEVVVTPSGEVGSLGVYMMHLDESAMLERAGLDVTLTAAGKYKTEGNKFERLSPEAREDRQHKVDTVHERFISDVAEGRKVAESTVRNGYGEGRTLLAGDAVREGLADRVATMDEVLGGLTAQRAESAIAAQKRRQRRAAMLFQPSVSAD